MPTFCCLLCIIFSVYGETLLNIYSCIKFNSISNLFPLPSNYFDINIMFDNNISTLIDTNSFPNITNPLINGSILNDEYCNLYSTKNIQIITYKPYSAISI